MKHKRRVKLDWLLFGHGLLLIFTSFASGTFVQFIKEEPSTILLILFYITLDIVYLVNYSRKRVKK